jgi:hypothetical protein
VVGELVVSGWKKDVRAEKYPRQSGLSGFRLLLFRLVVSDWEKDDK